MRAISLTQPWASLVALGEKCLETRAWSTRYRGRLVVHATREAPRWSEDDAVRAAIDTVLERYGFETSEGPRAGALLLPRSALLATCVLESVFKAEAVAGGVNLSWFRHQEMLFGDFSPGRFAWGFASVVRFVEPIPARGFQGLWSPSRELVEAIEREGAAP